MDGGDGSRGVRCSGSGISSGGRASAVVREPEEGVGHSATDAEGAAGAEGRGEAAADEEPAAL